MEQGGQLERLDIHPKVGSDLRKASCAMHSGSIHCCWCDQNDAEMWVLDGAEQKGTRGQLQDALPAG